MERSLSVCKTGCVLGILMGGYHACWAALVALEWAQPVIDFVFRMHFIRPVLVIEPFHLARAAALVGITAAIGFAVGAAFAWIWNRFHQSNIA